MPSMEAPQHYERSKGIMPGEFDPFFKYVEPDFYEAETGNVESPLGWVGLLRVDQSLIESMETYAWPIDCPEEGWYIVRINDHGLVWGMTYGGTDTFPEEGARADFAEAEKVYAEWCRIEDEGCDCSGIPDDDHSGARDIGF